MTSVYLKPEGFQKKSLQEIRAELEQTFRDIFGPDIDIRPEGRTGHLIAILAKLASDSWEGAQEIYASFDPSQAENEALDRICAWQGIHRIAASKSIAPCACYVESENDGTLIPAGRQVRRVRGALVFSLRDDTTVSSSACRDLYLQASGTLTPGSTITLTTTFGTFTVTVPATANPNKDAYALLADAINATTWTGIAQAYSQGNAPSGAQLNEDCLRLVDPTADFGLVYSSAWVPALIGSIGNFECSIYGQETADVGEISEIVTPEPGWTLVYNLVSANPGRVKETDEQLRIRREQVLGTGNATERAILNRVYNHVDGIVSASIRSNRTKGIDSDGRPPKSFEVVAQGGIAQQIGQAIWDTQPAGIESYGNQSVTVVDSQGNSQVVKYTLPIESWLWIDVRFRKYDDESFPANGISVLRDNILEWSTLEFTVGKDVIPQRVLSPIYKVSGIGEVQVRVAVTAAGDTPSFPSGYTLSPIVVGGRSVVTLAYSRLTITEGNFL